MVFIRQSIELLNLLTISQETLLQNSKVAPDNFVISGQLNILTVFMSTNLWLMVEPIFHAQDQNATDH